MLSQLEIDNFNRFILKTKCSINMAIVAGYRVSVGNWNLLITSSQRYIISPRIEALPITSPQRRLDPLSMLLVGKPYSGNKYRHLERLHHLDCDVVAVGVCGGLTDNLDYRDYACNLGEQWILAYNIGIHLRDQVHDTRTNFIAPIPAGISLFG